MLKYIIICLFFVFVSCNSTHKQEIGGSNKESNFNAMEKDTLITYDIEGISTEGAETVVNYVNGNIAKSVTNIYGETGKATIIYEFNTDQIKVSETKYSYKTGIEKVRSNEDIQLDYKISYFIDFKGSLVGKEILDRIDIFEEFKEAVPFKLE